MKDLLLRKMLKRTPAGRVILKSLKLSGADEEIFLGKGFFKKAAKRLSKVGKITGKITGRIARVGAGLIGIPPGALDALSKIDPTASKRLQKRIAESPTGQKAAELITKSESKIKPVYIAAGAAGIIAIILMTKRK